jgi:hypothetical protein
MSNNNADDIDEYEYVTYADKYFGDQIFNETKYTSLPKNTKVLVIPEPDNFENFQLSPVLEIEKYEK